MWDVNLIDGSPVLPMIGLQSKFDAVIKIEELLEGGGTIELEFNRALDEKELLAFRVLDELHNIGVFTGSFPTDLVVRYAAVYETLSVAREIEKILRILGFSKILFHLNPSKGDREEFFTLLDTPTGAN